ncbi:hypothetical protein DVH24_030815, partial [Malus domestica]
CFIKIVPSKRKWQLIAYLVSHSGASSGALRFSENGPDQRPSWTGLNPLIPPYSRSMFQVLERGHKRADRRREYFADERGRRERKRGGSCSKRHCLARRGEGDGKRRLFPGNRIAENVKVDQIKLRLRMVFTPLLSQRYDPPNHPKCETSISLASSKHMHM